MKEIIKKRIEKYEKDLLEVKEAIRKNDEYYFSKEYQEKDYELKILYYTYEWIMNELKLLQDSKNILWTPF